ncbi:MAG TPA: DEAD/DEAH box helicase [Geomonas sp.]|nr:DEAD/DEAH box helicase [Geomonas sp.]
MPQPDAKKLLQVFQRFQPDQKTLLQLLSVIYAPASKSAILNTARRYGLVTAEGRPHHGVSISEAIDRLKAAGMVRVSHDGFRCAPEIVHQVTLSAIEDGAFPFMVSAVQSEIPMVSDWGSTYYRSHLHALRDLRIAVYGKRPNLVFETLARYQRQFPYEMTHNHPFVALCNSPFDSSWFRTLPEEVQLPALSEILAQASADLSPSQPAFDLLAELAARPLPPGVSDFFCLELLLRGRLEEARQRSRKHPTAKKQGILGCLALLHGSHAESIEHFETGLLRLKKETGKRKTFFDDITGPLFILALVGTGDKRLLEVAAEHCTFVAKKKEWPHKEIYRFLQLVIRDRSGEHGIAAELERENHRYSWSPVYALFLVMALHWCDSPQAAEMATQLPPLSGNAREAGYGWLADEFDLAALACGVDTPAIRETEQRYKAWGLTPLVRTIDRIEFWDSALSALIGLNKKEDAPQKPAAHSRLIWHFQEDGRQIEIQPREQKLTPTGKWTSGKNISLKRLAEEAGQLDFLTEQDLRICGCINQGRERSYGYYGYGREVYRLDNEKALPLMIGHPNVYLDPAGTTRLELVHGEPELQVSTEGDLLQIRIYPSFEQDRDIHVVKESPTRLKVFEAREEYRQISAIVGDGLKVPGQAKQKALEAINTLSSIMTVHSDIGSDSAALLPADPTPCFHLLPYSSGIKLELLVRPFSDAGPYFRPGAGGETVLAELEGKRVQTRRDLRLELRRAADAVAALPYLPESEENDCEWLLPDPEDALEVLLQLQALGESVRLAWPDGAKFKVRQEATPGNCTLRIREAKDWFELDGEVRLNEKRTLDLQLLVDLARDGHGRFVPLGDGEFLALSAQLRKRIDEVASFADPHGKGFRFHRLAAGVFEEFADEAGQLVADQQWQVQLKRLRDAQNFRPQLPSTLQAELRPYQEEGFNWLNRLAQWGVGACLADDMGLGKTVQALAQILAMAAHGPSLVVAPTSVCLNWESETLKFAPTLKVVMFGGNQREATIKRLEPFDLVICSYGLLQQEGHLLASVKWQAIVLDEAQAIKNMATKRSQAAMELTGAFKMVATGTPIENHLGELWNVFRFINPGLLGSLKQFNVRFASPIEKSKDKRARARLKRLIQPFILRRTKNQVLEELPSRTEITVKVGMGEEEASFYEALRRSVLDNLAGVGKVEEKGETYVKILAEIMRLRRACCNPRLILPESRIPSAKLAAFAEILEELRENRHKALVFSQFVSHLEIIRQFVEKAGIRYQYLDGSTPPKERKLRMEAFQSGDGDLFLISLKAGGVGLNLTAADYVIHMDPWWNPAVEDQASDRAHRIGQQRPVTIYRLVTKGTIEEKIVGLHQHKRGLADSLLDETDLSGKISAEELLQLLRSES